MSEISTKKIDLKNVILSINNPRWKNIANLETNLIEMIIQQSDRTTEKEVIKKLLELEGDLRDFVDLVKSISEGFRDYEQGVFLIQKNNDQYVVAEGNRRILALKLLSKLVELPKLSEIKNNYEYDPDDDLDEEYSSSDEKKLSKNYEKLLKVIKSKNEIYGKTEFNFFIVNKYQNEILWKIIFSKHIGGVEIGLRRWGRGKYFVDLLNFFPKGMKKEYKKLEEKKIESRLQRRLTKIKMDYKHAQFVYAIANSNLENENMAKEWMKKNPVSALQSNFCLIPIKNIAQFYDYTDEDFKKFIFNFCYNEKNYLLNFMDDENKIIRPTQMLIFIKEWFERKVITTRKNIEKNEQYFNFVHAFAKLIKRLSLDNPFEWNKKQMEIKIKETKNKLEKEFLKKFQEIEKKYEEIFKKIYDLENFGGFLGRTIKELNEQLRHNSKNNLKYIHASAITIRTILEIFVIFSLFFVPDFLKRVVDKITKDGKKIKFKAKKGLNLDYEKKICALFLTCYIRTDPINQSLEDYLKNSKNFLSEMISNILKKNNALFLKKFNYIWNKRKFMNEIIHNYFRILSEKTKINSLIIKQLTFIDDTNKFVSAFLGYLDLKKLREVDEKIMNVQKSMESEEIEVIIFD